VAYLTYRANNIDFLITFTGDQDYGATYFYVVPNGISTNKKAEFFEAVLIDSARAVCSFVKDIEREKEMKAGVSMSYHIPVFSHEKTFCFVRYNHYSEKGRPATPVTFKNWFIRCRKIDKENENQKIKQKLIENRNKQCKELVITEQGRAKLLEMLASNDNKKIFGDTFFFKNYQDIIVETLSNYYVYLRNEDIQKRNVYYRSAWYPELLSSAEIAALKKLLVSDDIELKKYAMHLINTTACRSLFPEFLQMCLDKEPIPNLQGGYLIPDDPNEKPRIYKFNVYRLLGELGDDKTLRSLKALQKNDQISLESKADIELAIDHIKTNLERAEKQKTYFFETRKEIRERKLMVFTTPDDPLIADLDKPDPEPVSSDGYRNWETTDGLFKTTARFVGLKDIINNNAVNKDQDVQLLRRDGQEVAIELSALRPADREYIRQHFEPLRNWTTNDGKLKIKAKLLSKFDKEIIVQEPDGINTRIKIGELSDADKEYLKPIPLSPHPNYPF
jgi:hypothetical protein